MGRLRINKSFEEELAGKADEFRMQPRPDLWANIESGIESSAVAAKAKYLASATGAAIIGLSFFLFTTVNPSSETAIVVSTPPTENAVDQNGIPRDSRLFISESDLAGALPANTAYYNDLIVPFGDYTYPSYQEKPEVDNQPDQLAFVPVVAVEAAPEEVKKTAKVLRPIKPMPKGDAWHLAFSAGPSYAFHTTEGKQSFAEPLSNQKAATDKPVIGFSARLTAKYYFNQAFAVSTGIGYNRWGEYIGIDKGSVSPYYMDIARELGYSPEDLYSPGTNKYQNIYNQVEIPVLFHFEKSGFKRLTFGTTLGVSFAYTFGEHYKSYDYLVEHYVKNPDVMRSFNASLIGNISAMYHLKNNMVIVAGPEARYSFLSTYSDLYPISQHQYSYGLHVGIQWKLFKNKQGLDK